MQASNILMIEPVAFGFNPQTAVNNSFQQETSANVQEAAASEFKQLVQMLVRNHVNVTVIRDTPEPATPDSIFPNNWISFHQDNSVFLYPMFAANRRQE